MALTGKTEVLEKIFVPLPLFSIKIPHGLGGDGSRPSMVTGWRLTA